MAFDKVVDSAVLDTKLTSVADAIRSKTGKTDKLTLEQMPGEIEGIQAGGDDSFLLEYNNNALTEFSNDEITSLTALQFKGFTALEYVNLPNVTSFNGTDKFNGCSALKTINVPKLNSLPDRSFDGCSNLTAFAASLNQAVGGDAFRNCSNLIKVDLGHTAYFWNAVFQGCTSLKTVIIRNGGVMGLKNVNSFTDTPFASGGTGGTVYVPSALIESYQTATNWSTLYAAGTCNFVAIEGSEYE